MKNRTCTVAGEFYARDPHHLEQLLEKFFIGKETGLDAMGIVVPHAGYVYSGDVAGWAYSAIPRAFEGTFVVIGPSHNNFPTCISHLPWETPLGIVDNDTALASLIDLHVDEVSHQRKENSLEVQMPFIKFRYPRSRVVPILMGNQDFESAKDLSEIIGRGVRRSGREDIRFIASSDFSHEDPSVVPVDVFEKTDHYVIAALEDLNIEEFYRRIRATRISSCGYGPIAVMCLVCKGLGATRGKLLKYATSADVKPDPDYAVGYGAVAVM